MKENERLQAQLRENQTMLAGMEEKKADKAEVIVKEYEANVAKYDSSVEEYKELSEKEVQGLLGIAESGILCGRDEIPLE